MTINQLIHIIGLVLGLLAVAFAYMWIPPVTAVLSVPLGFMRLRDNHLDDESVRPPTHYLALWSNYAIGSLLFLLTSGNLAQVNFAAPATNEAQKLAIVSLTAGLLIVAMVRIECVFHTQDLLNSFQQFVIAALGFTVVLAIVKFDTISELQGFVRFWFLDANGFLYLLVESLVSAVFVEFLLVQMIRRPNFRWVSYDLLRQRIESTELIEQEWESSRVNDWTIRKAREAIEVNGPSDVCWLTETMPRKVLDALNGALTDWANNQSSDPVTLRENVRVLTRIPAEKWPKNHVLASRIRHLDQSAPLRLRLLVIGGRVAIISFPSRDPRGVSNLSSDCAAIVEDPARIAEYQTWFNRMWESNAAPRSNVAP